MRYLLAWAAQYGVRATITSGTRSSAEQAALYARGGPYPVARPGTSKHEQGRAVDVSASRETLAWLGQVWEAWIPGGKWGGRWRTPDPVHYEY
jgi:hypothetical protein